MTKKIADFCRRNEIGHVLPGKSHQDQVTILNKNEETGEITKANVPKKVLYSSKKKSTQNF